MSRYYRADIQQYKPVSTEITGYTASAYVYLFERTQDEEYLDRARLTARFLCDHAWDAELATFPFEHPSPSSESEHQACFFDCGIIIRGLLAVRRITQEDRLLDIAQAAARGMIADFHSGADYHPILALPGKQPLDRKDHWSWLPGCYQLKSALAWFEAGLRDPYLEMLEAALKSYRAFLPGTPERLRVMDRLHAYCYFLEGMTPTLDRADCVEAYRYGLEQVAHYVADLEADFVRSDVYAQLLRARLRAKDVIPPDVCAARREAKALAAFQSADGGFYFGRRAGEILPHINPVSTAFALQALEMWRQFEAGELSQCLIPPI